MTPDEARVGARVTWAENDDPEFYGPPYLPGEHVGMITEVNAAWVLVAWDDGDLLTQHVAELQLLPDEAQA